MISIVNVIIVWKIYTNGGNREVKLTKYDENSNTNGEENFAKRERGVGGGMQTNEENNTAGT